MCKKILSNYARIIIIIKIIKIKVIFSLSTNIFEFGLSIQEAIDTQRAFALNGKLKVEKTFSESLINDLSILGHDIQLVEDAIGGGQAIMIDRKKGILIGGSDSRKDGLAIGY